MYPSIIPHLSFPLSSFRVFYLAYGETYSTTPVLGLRRVFLICRNCFLDMVLSVVAALSVLSVWIDFCKFLYSFSALRLSFSNRRSRRRTASSRFAVDISCCNSSVSVRWRFRACRSAKDFTWLLMRVCFNELARFCVRPFQVRPDALRPFGIRSGCADGGNISFNTFSVMIVDLSTGMASFVVVVFAEVVVLESVVALEAVDVSVVVVVVVVVGLIGVELRR